MAISSNLYKQQLYLDFCYAQSLLKCENKQYIEGLNDLINVARKVKNVGIIEKFKLCLLSIWHYRDHLTDQLNEDYIQMLSEDRNQANNLYAVSP